MSMSKTHTTLTRRIILSIIVAGITASAIITPGPSLSVFPAGAAAAVADLTSPEVTTPEHSAVIEWAFDLFDQAGLDLGGVRVGIHDDPSACNGYRGLHIQGEVTVCALDENPSVQEAWRRHTLLHELAHAWADVNVSEQDREAFNTQRSAVTWQDADAPWEDRGAEHAAEIIAWAVADYAVYPHISLADRTCESFAEGYVTLTGTEAPRGTRCE
jgi:hypothetical protein